MRYLKLYENFDNFSNIKDFCEENLISLTDEGFELQIYSSDSGHHIWLLLDDDLDNNTFKWVDIKDEFIPFLIKLNTYYNISEHSTGKFIIFTERSIKDYFKYDDIIEDDMSNGLGGRINLNKLNSIGLLITSKKENL